MTTRERILAAARASAPGAIRTPDLMMQLEGNRETIYTTLAQMVERGELIRARMGEYRMPESLEERTVFVLKALGEIEVMANAVKASAARSGATDLALRAGDIVDRIEEIREGVTT